MLISIFLHPPAKKLFFCLTIIFIDFFIIVNTDTILLAVQIVTGTQEFAE